MKYGKQFCIDLTISFCALISFLSSFYATTKESRVGNGELWTVLYYESPEDLFPVGAVFFSQRDRGTCFLVVCLHD